MADSENENQPLNQFRRISAERSRRRFPASLIIIVLGIGAGAFFILSGRTSSILSVPWGQTVAQWTVPLGRPSMGEAEACLREQDLSCAEADMLAYLNKYPNDAHATAMLALTLTEDGRHKEALYYYQKAEAMGVGTYDFYAGYAKTLDAMGDMDGAIAKNRLALKIVPTLVDVRGALADELVRKGRKSEALDLLTSFDDQLESEGQRPYFADQIRRIKIAMGGKFATEALSEDAPLPPAAPGETLVEGEPEHGTLAVPVSIDGMKSKSFTIDSGASVVTIPNADAAPLLAQGLIGPNEFRGTERIVLADGTVMMARLYMLHSVKVGNREVDNVLAAIYPGDGMRLLGQSFLKRFKSWSINNGKRVLVLDD